MIHMILNQPKGSSLNYVGQARQRLQSLFLCASVVGSGSRFTPDAKGDREFGIQVHPYYIARSHRKDAVMACKAGNWRVYQYAGRGSAGKAMEMSIPDKQTHDRQVKPIYSARPARRIIILI